MQNDLIPHYIVNGMLNEFKQHHGSYKTQYIFHAHVLLAVEYQQTCIIDYLLQLKTKYNLVELLRECLARKSFDMFQHIFNQTGTLNESHTRMLLLMCVANNWHETVEYLYSKNINLRLDNDCALSTAISFGHMNLVTYLLQKGLQIKKLPYHHLRRTLKQPSDYFKPIAHLLILHILKKNKNYQQPIKYPKKILNQTLKICSDEGYAKGAKILIAKGANYKIAQKSPHLCIKSLFIEKFHSNLSLKIPAKAEDKQIKKI